MKSFLSNLKGRHNDNDVFTNSIQTGYFLMLSFFLLMIIVVMLAVNIGYDKVKTSLEGEVNKMQIEQVVGDNELLSVLVESEEVSGFLIKSVTYLKETETKLERSVKFEGFQIIFFMLLFLLVLILAPEKFKISLNSNEESHQKNIFVNIITRIIASILMTVLLVENIVIQFLSISGYQKWGIEIAINLILLLLIYLLLLDGRKSFKIITLSSLIASIAISLAFYLLLFLSSLIAAGNIAISIVTFLILFMMSLMIIVYIIILSKEVASSMF